MPPELNDDRIAELRRMIVARSVVFERRAHYGHRLGAEPDDIGLNGLLPARLPPDEKEARLLRAMVDFLDNGSRPNRLDETYGTVYEFRFDYRQLPIYVKTKWPPDDAAAPVLVVCSVKKQN